MNIFRSGATLAAANILSSIAAFVVLSRLLAVLGLPNFAKVSFMLTCVTVFQIIFSTQSWQGILKKFTSSIPRQIVIYSLMLDSVVSMTGAVILYMAITSLASAHDINELGLAILAINVFFVPNGVSLAIIRSNNLYSIQALTEVTVALTKLLVVFTVSYTGPSITYFLIILVLPEFIRWLSYIAVLFIYGRRDVTVSKQVRNVLREIYGFSSWGVLTEIIYLPAAHLDKLIIGTFLGLQAQAIWDLIKRCITALVQVTNVVNQQLFPYYIKKIEPGQNNTNIEIYSHMIGSVRLLRATLFCVYLTAGLTFYLWFPRLFSLPEDLLMSHSAQATFIAFSSVMVFTFGSVPVHPMFLAIEGSRPNFMISAIGNLANLLIALVTVPVFGIFGAILATAVSDGSIITYKFAACKRWVKRNSLSAVGATTN